MCLACGDRCDYMSNAEVDNDWLDKVQELVMRWEGGDHNTVPTQWEAEPPKDEAGEPGPQEGS